MARTSSIYDHFIIWHSRVTLSKWFLYKESKPKSYIKNEGKEVGVGWGEGAGVSEFFTMNAKSKFKIHFICGGVGGRGCMKGG